MAERKVICDTDVIIDYWDQKRPRHLETRQIIDQKIGREQVVISAITKIELLTGAQNKHNLVRISKNIDQLIVALIDKETTNFSFSLFQKYTLSHALAMADGLIAATAIVSNTELFTYNVKDYKFITGLKLFLP